MFWILWTSRPSLEADRWLRCSRFQPCQQPQPEYDLHSSPPKGVIPNPLAEVVATRSTVIDLRASIGKPNMIDSLFNPRMCLSRGVESCPWINPSGVRRVSVTRETPSTTRYRFLRNWPYCHHSYQHAATGRGIGKEFRYPADGLGFNLGCQPVTTSRRTYIRINGGRQQVGKHSDGSR